MARKSRPVLYEVVRGTARQQPPGWSPGSLFRQRDRSETAAPEPEPAAVAPAPAAMRAPASEPDYSDDSPPWFRWVDRHALLRLGWPGLTIGGAALVVLLILAFAAGRRSVQADGSPGARTQIAAETPRREEPLVKPLPTKEVALPQRAPDLEAQRQPATPPTRAPATAEFVKGKYYVIVQFFSKSNRRHAEEARDFLSSRGIPCTIREVGPDIRLVANEAFALDEGTSAERADARRRVEALKKRIKEAGKEFVKAGGGYTFDLCEERRF